MDHLCYLCLVSVVLLRQFIAVLWSPAGKGILALVCDDVKLCFVTFPCGILGQVWYLIVSILIFAAFLTSTKFVQIISLVLKWPLPWCHMFYICLYRKNVQNACCISQWASTKLAILQRLI